MSLSVEIDVSLNQKQINQEISAPDERLRIKYKQNSHDAHTHVYLSGVHDFLSDNFDLGGKFILLENEVKLPFQSYIKALWQSSDKVFKVTFLWAGERIEHQVNISLDDFLLLIEENKLLNRSCYTITG